MELYILSKQNLKVLSMPKIIDYQINLDEETNLKSTLKIMKTEGLEEGNYIVLNGLYRQFLFVISAGGVLTEKDSNVVTLNVSDISNIFDRKVIEKKLELMTIESIEKFIAETIYDNFVNSNDTFLNIGYIDITWHTNTKGTVATNSENGLYNFHTFLINCRQNKNIYTEFKFENNRLKIDISYKEESTEMIDTTLPEVVDYNKIYEEEATAKVQVYIRENDSEYNLYLKTDKSTTEDKNDPNRANGKIEVISVDTADKAKEEALNVMKGNRYKHLVEFKISKTSQLMDITKLYIGRAVRIKTEDDIYDSYISAITLNDENFVYFKSGTLRIDFLDKLKKTSKTGGEKLDKTGGIIQGNLSIQGKLEIDGKQILSSELDSNIKKNTNFTKVALLPVDPNVQTQYQIGNYVIPEDGTYLIVGCVHTNFYGQDGRELNIILYKDWKQFYANIGVCNTYIWTLTRSINAIHQFKKGNQVEIVISNGDGSKMWSNSGGEIYIIRLNDES